MRWWILLYTYAVLGSLVDGETVIPNDSPGAEEDRQRKRRLLCDAATILSFQPRKRPKHPRLHRRANDVQWCGWIGIRVFAACQNVTDGTVDRNN